MTTEYIEPGMTWGRWYWPLFLSLFMLALLIPEVYALVTNTKNTLSEWVWWQLKVSTQQQLPWTAAHFLVLGSWIVVQLWLTFHFFFRRFT